MEWNNFNLGWFFYKAYYREEQKNGFKKLVEGKKSTDKKNLQELGQKFFDKKNTKIFEYSMPESQELKEPYELYYLNDRSLQSFILRTSNPGLLVGSGYAHSIGVPGEIKIGFYFDHTTGLPTIPGSSIKGLIRSVFTDHPDYIVSLLQEITKKIYTNEQIDQLCFEIFEGRPSKKQDRNVSVYAQDWFFDAIILAEKKLADQCIVGKDFITPHKSPLENPTPIQFLKVLPGVAFKFLFELKNSKVIPELTKDKKCQLFRKIILALGLGAKTNVGYGQFN